MSHERVLVVDDEDTLRVIIQGILEEFGFEVILAASAEEALPLLQSSNPAVAIFDIILPGMSGLDLLERAKELSPDTQVLIMTSHSSVETAIQAIRQGAYDYLEKPFDDVEAVPLRVKMAAEKRSLTLANRALLADQQQRNKELTAAVERLSSMLDAGRTIGEFTSLNNLMDSFIGMVAEELKVDRASLMLIDTKTNNLWIAASRGITGIDIRTVRVPLGEGIAGLVALSGEPMLVKDLAREIGKTRKLNTSLSDSFISAPIILSMPIKFQNKVLGVINVTNRRNGVAFDKNDLDYVSSMAGQLAVATERTRHFEDLQQAYQSLKMAQEQLVISERVQAVGQMAAGVAHDFNNCLGGIQGRAELLMLKLGAQSIDRNGMLADLETIMKLSQQGAETIKRVQTYTTVKKGLPDAPVDLNAVIKEALSLTQPKWKGECESQGRAIEPRLELGEIPMVTGHGAELTQLMINLIFNAVEAMPAGGSLTFRTSHEGDSVFADVIDTGTGMNEDTRKHLFEPFFTTKESGQGLGTSVVYAIIARHRGEITVSSKEREGTAFRLKLPEYRATGATAVESRKEASTRRPAGTRARILLIEDENVSRQTYKEMLAAGGHDVVTAANGSEGLSAFKAANFDIVFTDLCMPGISGLEVASGIKSIRPGTPVVLLSGWAVQQEEEQTRKAGVDVVLPKPSAMKVLHTTVQDLVKAKSEVQGKTK